MSRSNVLVIVLDCGRADYVHGEGLAHKPAIDLLAGNGFSFLNAISTASTTTPCFASILTGLYPFQHGVRSHSGYALKEDVPTLPEMLRGEGYHTYAEMTGPLAPEIGLTRGFDDYGFRTRKETLLSGWGQDFLRKFEGGHFREPWLVFLHIWDLHRPRQVHPECQSRKFGRHDYAKALSSIDRYLASLLPRTPENTLVVLTSDHGEDVVYGALRSELSRMRRNLYRYLRKRGLARKHPSRALRGIRDGHGHAIYDELVRVPLILHGRGLIPPGRSELQVRHIDLLPTILDALGITLAHELTGESLMGIIRGEGGSHRDAYLEAVGLTIPDKKLWLAGIRTNNTHKYIYAPHIESFEPELYDLESDPGERRNIAKASPALASALRARIESLKTEEMVGKELTDEEKADLMARLKDLGYVD